MNCSLQEVFEGYKSLDTEGSRRIYLRMLYYNDITQFNSLEILLRNNPSDRKLVSEIREDATVVRA